MRTQITQNNPESSFGEISRIVGNEVFIYFLLFIFNLLYESTEEGKYED